MPGTHVANPPSASPPAGTNLQVNDGPLAPEDVGLLHKSSPDEPLEVLRQRYQKDGYLYLRGLIPREDVLSARASYFEELSVTGLREPGTNYVEGILNKSEEPSNFPNLGSGDAVANSRLGDTARAELFENLAVKAHVSEWYIGSSSPSIESSTTEQQSDKVVTKDEPRQQRGFVHHPMLRKFIPHFTGWGNDNTLELKRSLLRNNCPTNRAIGVHYDQIFLRHGLGDLADILLAPDSCINR